MKILNVCHDDFANFSYSNCEALKSVGQDCYSVKLQSHPFNYPKESTIIPATDIIELVKSHDVIQFFHDNISFFNMILPYCKGKKLIAYHTTSLYRKDYERINSQMNPHIFRAVNCMPEFMGKGAKNEVYMVGAVDTEGLKCNKEIKRPYIIAHYPSNPEVKGTEKIIELMNQIPGDRTRYEFRCSKEQVGYEKQIERLKECDIYIEMFTEKDGLGSDYGDFGITALEAAAMGKLVVTQSNHLDLYLSCYGGNFFTCFKGERKFKELISWLASSAWFPDAISSRVDYYHGYKASGEYILKNILN